MTNSPAALKKRIRVLEKQLQELEEVAEVRLDNYKRSQDAFLSLSAELHDLKQHEIMRPWWKKLLGIRK